MSDHSLPEPQLAPEVRMLLAETPWNVIIIARAGSILAISQPLLDLLGASEAQVLGQQFAKLVLPGERAGVGALIGRAIHEQTKRATRLHLSIAGRTPVAVDLELYAAAADAPYLTAVVYPISVMHRRERLILEFNRMVPLLLTADSPAELYRRTAGALRPLGLGLLVLALDAGADALRVEFLSVHARVIDLLNRKGQLNIEQLRVPLTTPFVRDVIEKRRTVFLANFEPLFEALMRPHTARFIMALLWAVGAPSCILAPLLAGAEVRGILLMWSNVLAPEQLPFFEAFAHQIAALLAQLELRAQMLRQMLRLDSLAATARAVTHLGSLDAALRSVCEQAYALFDANFVAIAQPVPGQEMLECIMVHGQDSARWIGTRMAYDSSVSGLAWRSGQGICVPDVAADPRVHATFRSGQTARSMMTQPLLHQGQALGVLTVGHATVGQFGPHDLDQLGRYAEYAAVAIANARMHQALHASVADNARLYREAEATRSYLNTLIHNTPDLLLTIRADLTIHVVNPERLASSRLGGTTLEGCNVFELVPARMHADLAERWRVLRRGQPQMFELDLSSINNTPLYVLISAALIADYSEVFVIVKDVTDQRERAAHLHQAEKLAALGRMVAGAAHELNNPLATILGLAQLQLNEALPAELHADFAMIERATLRARDIIQQLGSFARPLPPQNEPVSIGRLIEKALERQSAELRAHQIQVAVEVPADLPPAEGDPHQLAQVLFNIIDNAVQALGAVPPEARRLRIQAQAVAGTLLIELEDSGEGIAPGNLAQIFEPFFTTRVVGQGAGLGLALSHAIIHQHNGQIWASSPPGQGATFFIQLPRAHHPAAPARKGVGGARVLVIADDQDVHTRVAQPLASRGFHITTAASGAEAIERARSGGYQLLISNLHMPGIDGQTLYARLRPQLPDLCWIFLTGAGLSQRGQRFLDQTGLAALAEPFTDEQLVRQVFACLTDPTV